jgi:hypothetical protein
MSLNKPLTTPRDNGRAGGGGLVAVSSDLWPPHRRIKGFYS